MYSYNFKYKVDKEINVYFNKKFFNKNLESKIDKILKILYLEQYKINNNFIFQDKEFIFKKIYLNFLNFYIFFFKNNINNEFEYFFNKNFFEIIFCNQRKKCILFNLNRIYRNIKNKENLFIYNLFIKNNKIFNNINRKILKLFYIYTLYNKIKNYKSSEFCIFFVFFKYFFKIIVEKIEIKEIKIKKIFKKYKKKKEYKKKLNKILKKRYIRFFNIFYKKKINNNFNL